MKRCDAAATLQPSSGLGDGTLTTKTKKEKKKKKKKTKKKKRRSPRSSEQPKLRRLDSKLLMVGVMTDQALEESLNQLVEKSLLIVRETAGGTWYSFRNSMIRKGAYGMMTLTQKMPLHETLAKYIEEVTNDQVAQLRRSGAVTAAKIASGDFTEDQLSSESGGQQDSLSAVSVPSLIRQYSLLAQHLDRAGLFERSLTWGLRAISLASSMHIDESVIAIAREALSTLDRVENVNEDHRLSFTLFFMTCVCNFR